VPQNPDIRSVLDPLQVDKSLKKTAWDSYYGANSPDEFRQKFDSLAIPKEAKKQLWDMKFGGKPKVNFPIPQPFETGPQLPEKPEQPGIVSQVLSAASNIPLLSDLGIPSSRGPMPVKGAGVADVTGARGYPEMYQGAKEFYNADQYADKRRAQYQGAARTIGGAMEAAKPLMYLSAAEAPIDFAAGLALSQAGSYGAEHISRNYFKASPEAQQLWGQLGGFLPMAGGMARGSIRGYKELRSNLVSKLADDMLKQGATPEMAQQAAEHAVQMYEATGDAQRIGAENAEPPSATKVAKIQGRKIAGGVVGAAQHAAPLPEEQKATPIPEFQQAPVPTDKIATPTETFAQPETPKTTPAREILSSSPSSESAFMEPPKVEAAQPTDVRSETRHNITTDAVTGEQKVARKELPPAQERAQQYVNDYQNFDKEQQQLERSLKNGRLKNADATRQRVELLKQLKDKAWRNYVQYADRGDVVDTLKGLAPQLKSLADQSSLLQSIGKHLADGSYTLYKATADKSNKTYVPDDLIQSALGTGRTNVVPPVPKDFVDSLPEGSYKEQLKALNPRSQEIRQAWVSKYLLQTSGEVRNQYEALNDRFNVALKVKGVRPEEWLPLTAESKPEPKGLPAYRPETPAPAVNKPSASATERNSIIEYYQKQLAAAKTDKDRQMWQKSIEKEQKKLGKVPPTEVPKTEPPLPKKGFSEQELPDEMRSFLSANATMGMRADGDIGALRQLAQFGDPKVSKRARLYLKALGHEVPKVSKASKVESAPSTSEGTPAEKSLEAAQSAQAAGKPLSPLSRKEVLDVVDKEIAKAGFDKAIVKDIRKLVLDTYAREVAAGNENALEDVKGVIQSFANQKGVFSFRRIPGTPQGPSVFSRLADTLDRTLNKSEQRQLAENVLREGTGSLARDREKVFHRLEDHLDRHDGDNVMEFREFMDAGEGKPGARFLNPQDQAIANDLHQMFQERWAKLQQMGIVDPTNAGIQNYLKHLWERPNRAIDRNLLFGKRPIAGPGTFLKERFYDYMSDGLDAGLKPVTYNPIKMQLMGMFEIDRFIRAHEMKDDLMASRTSTGARLMKWYKLGESKPPGWQKIDDRLFQPKFMTKSGLTEAGAYWAHPDVAKVFNNYLSTGLQNEAWYRGARHFGNFLNRMQLSTSAFHATFEVLNSTISEVALGFQKAFNNRDFGAAAKHIFRSPVAAAHYWKLGKMIEAEYLTPSNNLQLASLAKSLEIAGGRIGLDPLYTNNAVEAFHRAVTDRSLKALPRAVDALVEKSSNWLMKNMVPRIKIGMFAEMADHRLNELMNAGASRETISTELGKLWDSVDNRAGQLVYDNLFWSKTRKDLGFLVMRSQGWNLGTLRELGGGMVDLGKMFGGNTRLTERTAYIMAMTATMGSLGAIYHYMETGQAPRKPADYFFPGKEGQKKSFPSYIRDVGALLHALSSPNKLQGVGTIAAHKLNPEWQLLYDLYTNHDFYDTQIYDPGDPATRQVWDVAKYIGKQATPISIQSAMERHRTGESWGSSVGGSLMGITPAPKYIGQSPAEEMAFELAKRKMESGPHSKDEFAREQAFQEVRRTLAQHGKLDFNRVRQLVADGKVTAEQVDRIYDEQGMGALERHVARLDNLKDMFTIWDLADPNEKVQLRSRILDVYDNDIGRLSQDQREYYTRRIRSEVLH